MFVTPKNKNRKTGQGAEVPDRTAVRTALSQDKDRTVLGRCVLVDIWDSRFVGCPRKKIQDDQAWHWRACLRVD